MQMVESYVHRIDSPMHSPVQQVTSDRWMGVRRRLVREWTRRRGGGHNQAMEQEGWEWEVARRQLHEREMRVE